MAKNKTLNPAEAHRKAQRKKELQKNKDKRKTTREFTTAKQDISPLEDEVEALEAKPNLTGEDKDRLRWLRSELTRIKKAKEEYLREHPEHRNLVYASGRKRNAEGSQGPVLEDRNIFGKDGLPLHPERSVYYDPVMNPYGIPPPGMPYRERATTPEQVLVSESDEELDIPMPPGPSTSGGGNDSDEEEDETLIPVDPLPPNFIPPLPPGPPPPNAILAPGFMPSYLPSAVPPPPPLPPSGLPPQVLFPQSGYPPIPPPPPIPATGIPPPPPIGFPNIPLNMPPPQAFANLPAGALPPPPLGFPNFPPNLSSAPSSSHLPPPPRGFRGSTQQFDPLSLPNVSAQSQPQRPPPPSSLPKKPPPPSSNKLALDDDSSAATVMAAPELRDLKKEVTAFVPRGVRQKVAPKETGVNAAPVTGEGEADAEEDVRPNLMDALAKAGITGRPQQASTSQKPNQDQQDEYDQFMADIGDLL